MRRRLVRLAAVAGLLLISTAGQAQAPKPAVRLDPIPAILDAFRTYQLVSFPGGHTDGNGAMGLLHQLIKNPGFAGTVNDIVVEFGSSRYQDLMDRYVRGDDVPIAQVRLAWLNAVQAGVSLDNANTDAFFKLVRDTNASLPPDKKIRVLLGDPPIDWDNVKNKADLRKWIVQRDSYPAHLVQREVLDRKRRALLVYANGHLQKKEILTNYDMSDWQSQTIVSLLERAGTRVFTVRAEGSLKEWQPDTASWKSPALTIIRDTVLGAADYSEYEDPGQRYRIRGIDDFVPLPKEQWARMRAEEVIDAVLYFGPDSDRSNAPLMRSLCDDPSYLKMRMERIAVAGLPLRESEVVKKLCAK